MNEHTWDPAKIQVAAEAYIKKLYPNAVVRKAPEALTAQVVDRINSDAELHESLNKKGISVTAFVPESPKSSGE